MCAVELEGIGSPAPKPKSTASGALRSILAADDRRTPTLLPAAGTPASPKGTAYNKRAVAVSDPSSTSLGDAIRGNTRQMFESSTETISKAVARSARERRGRESNNDGRADKLNAGNHVGGRDEAIMKLKEAKAELKVKRSETVEDIGDLEDEIKSDKAKAGKVGDVVGGVIGVLTAPVGFLTGNDDTDNPIAEKAEDLAASVLGLEGDKAELEATEKKLAAQEAEIDEQIEDLEDERTLNFLADVAQVTNMPAAVADVLEGSGSLDIRSAEEGEDLGSDAAYDRVSEDIIIEDDVLDDINEAMDKLRDDGIVNQDGIIVDEQAFDVSEDGDKAIAATVLIGAHEVTHRSQDEDGKVDRVHALAEQLADTAVAQANMLAGDRPDQAEGIMSGTKDLIENIKVNGLEYAGYVNQETLELQAGKTKKLFSTIDENGALLPRWQAIENIKALRADQPLVHGVSAGKSVADVTDDADEHDHDHDHDGVDEQSPTQGSTDPFGRDDLRLVRDLITPGRYTSGDVDPGRYTSGDIDPGRYTSGTILGNLLLGSQDPGRYTSGDIDPGRYTSGQLLGRLLLGSQDPGRYTSGDVTPGRYTSGDVTPGRYTSGDVTPGRYTSGDVTPGRYTSGDVTPGRYTSGDLTPGRYTSGDLTPGRYTSGDLTPGRYTSGDLTPGRYTSGDLTPGRYTSGDLTPGRYTSGDLTPGRYTSGDLTPGRYTSGDLTPGRYTSGDLDPT